jgi:hypothetical protein
MYTIQVSKAYIRNVGIACYMKRIKTIYMYVLLYGFSCLYYYKEELF